MTEWVKLQMYHKRKKSHGEKRWSNLFPGRLSSDVVVTLAGTVDNVTGGCTVEVVIKHDNWYKPCSFEHNLVFQ